MNVTTRTLLIGGLTAGAVGMPLWALVSLTQAATRDGFDLTRHPLSMLSNGDLGWLQIANFFLCGLLTIAGALGLRRADAGVWVPRLLLVNGVGWIGAGVFVIDPGDGFPAGTPYGVPAGMSGMGVGHMAVGAVAFAALIATCYVLGRRFGRAGERGSAVASYIAGTALLLGNGWAMTGGRYGSLTLAVGAITAMLWVAAVTARYAASMRRTCAQ
ncbi:DUF998 domain-containing protein [Nonomuraea longicatena]|uniref:DUF998 domain-containing protein n=1 Tax=Nonomuraea longicatena TaxID=83682 RepID=A0ABN1QU35_9ACTN